MMKNHWFLGGNQNDPGGGASQKCSKVLPNGCKIGSKLGLNHGFVMYRVTIPIGERYSLRYFSERETYPDRPFLSKGNSHPSCPPVILPSTSFLQFICP